MHGKKRERIIRVLLNDPDGKLTKYRVAKLADASIGWTMEYLKQLQERGLVKKTKTFKPEKMFDYWENISKKPKYFEFFLQSPEQFLRKINLKYALTTYRAENMLNHYLFPSRTDVYIKEADLNKWKENIIKNGLLGKGNFRILIEDEHVMYNRQKIKGLWIASTPQVMLDLKREGGVCLEAYEMMVKRYVRKK